MPRYRYKARNQQGQSVEAVAEAANDDQLEQDLARQGLILISVGSAERKGINWSGNIGGPPSLSPSDLIFLTMELATSYSAGLPLLSTLEDMAGSSESRTIRYLARGLADRIRGGSSLAEALSAYPKSFPSLYVELCGAAEKTGKLEMILEDLVRFLEWQRETRSQIVQATIYPISMVGAVIMLTLVLTLFVFPRFLSAFKATRAQLPVPTRILLTINDTVGAHKIAVAAVAFGVPIIYLALRNIPVVRRRIDMVKLRAPVTGPLLTKVLMSRFSHNLAMMIASGLDFGSALRLCERLMNNVVLSQLVSDARNAVEQGKPLSEAMARGNFVPSLVRRMLKLGESTGEMESSLENVSKYYDKEIPKAVKRMFAVVEPLILVVMAGVVLFMASAVLLPLYGMINQIGRQ